ncbi:uncharacterized protein LOC110450374 isoform X2 [Mizuhopecten yessoensis]|nr:uncharacterized protein LOC110450374 isoform X2 [Mizuhopecten yessoensis]
MKGCKEIVMQSTALAMKDPEQEQFIFQYGPTQGDPVFRKDLAEFLSKEYDDHVKSDNLMVTVGATHGLHVTASILFDHNLPIFVEDPTFHLAFKILKDDLGKTVIPVPTSEDGVDLTRLEELLQENRAKAGDKATWKSPFWTMLYTMTVYGNPTGQCSSPEQCRKLINLARKYDVLLFSDDVYNLFHFGKGKQPARLLAYDKSDDPNYIGCVLSNGTFSKIFAPGIRLGWMEGHKEMVDLLACCYTSYCTGSFNHYMSLVMSAAIQLGLMTTHLNRIRGVYKTRMGLMCDALQKYLPTGFTFNRPQGGFFIWVTMPETMDAKVLQKFAKKFNVVYIDGESTSPTCSFRNCIRLTISFCDTDQIEEGTQRLAKAIQAYRNSLDEPTPTQ